MAGWGLGADVASAGELLVALQARFPPERIFIGGPYKSLETLDLMRPIPEAILSIDSLSELRFLASQNVPHRALLRLRPNCSSCSCEDTGFQARFGITFDELPLCCDYLAPSGIAVVGFHVFSSCQVLDPIAIVRDLRSAVDLLYVPPMSWASNLQS